MQISYAKSSLITYSELNDLFRDLNLPKIKECIWVSNWNSRRFWKIMFDFLCFGTVRKFLLHSLTQAMIFLRATFFVSWGLSQPIINMMVLKLKTVMLHNGNVLPSIPVADAVRIK